MPPTHAEVDRAREATESDQGAIDTLIDTCAENTQRISALEAEVHDLREHLFTLMRGMSQCGAGMIALGEAVTKVVDS